MGRVFLISGYFLSIITFIILSFTSCYQALNESQIETSLNWCSQRHCKDCNNSKISICANGALSNKRGDLCGCCHSCVQIREIGESCGSQLTVRSSAREFDNSKLEITVLSTTSCRLGLVCINFTCETLRGEVDKLTTAPVELVDAKIDVKFQSFENDSETSEDSDDPRTNEIPVERTNMFYYSNIAYDDIEQNTDTNHSFTVEKIDPRTSTAVHSTATIKSNIGAEKDEEELTQSDVASSNTESQIYNAQNKFRKNPIDSSERLVNVIMGDREFQLIYSDAALIDLKLLLNSINKSKSASILDEFEALLLYEQFKDILEVVSKDKISNFEDVAKFSSADITKQNHRENDSFRNSGLAILRKFVVPRISRLSRPRIPSRIFRRKRELEETEKKHSNNEKHSEFVMYDFSNKTSKRPKDEDIDSAINIHITGVPRVTKLMPESDLIEKERIRMRRTDGEDYENYDDKLEIFVTNGNTNPPEFSRIDENLHTSSNLTSHENFEGNEDFIDNAAENYWENLSSMEKNFEFYDKNYEFTFPETPVYLENDYYNDFRLQINKTADEFKAQLDRIETKVFVIESSLWSMMRKLETIVRSKNKEDTKTMENTNESIQFNNQKSNLSEISNLRRSRTAKPEEMNQSMRRYVLLSQTKDLDEFKENSSVTKNNKNFNIEDEGIAQFIPIRSNRQWRTVNLQPSSSEPQKFSKFRERRYPDSRRRKIAQRRNRDFVTRRLNPRKLLKNDSTKETKRIQSPIFPSNDNAKLNSYSLKLISDPSSPNEQAVWPLNPAWKRQLSSRKNAQMNRRSETDEQPQIKKSFETLETQIETPSIPARISTNFDNRMSGSSMSFAAAEKHSFNDENDWSSWNEAPSLNLFVVNGDSSSEFEKRASSSQEMTETLVLPMTNENSEIEDSWDFAYPLYLDYSEFSHGNEHLENEKSPIINESTESPIDHRSSRRMSVETHEIKKRDISNLLHGESPNTKFPNTQNVMQHKNVFQKRSKRNVRMVDWLRAAQEYHERLREVRKAALRTWLASREELADTNLTDVKLFTSEVPTYLEKYKPSFTAEDDSMKTEESQVYPIEIRDSRSPIPDDSELFTEFLYNQSALLENDSESRVNVKNSPDSRSELNSAVPRKITIIATGNSTIRIEELPNMNESNDESLLDDQSAEGSIKNEQSTAMTSSDIEDFDHMYESVEAEEEDFDYGDPNFTLSRWLDEVDIIDAGSVEIPGDETKSIGFNDEEDYEVDELLSRSKRDSPLFLFKIKGNPSQEVLIWPSNWKDFINRHFKRNNTKSSSVSPQRLTNTSQTRISKIGLAKPPISNADNKNSSVETLSGDDSTVEMDLVKKLQHAFDNRPRQNRRKNRYRKSIRNYK